MSDLKYDVRITAHLFRRGELTEEELQQHLDQLPDDADESVETETRFTTPFADRQGPRKD